MTIKHYLAVLFMIGSLSVFGQTPGYFGKTVFVGLGTDIELIGLVDPYSNKKYAPSINLEIGKLLKPKMGVVLDVNNSAANITQDMWYSGNRYRDDYEVQYSYRSFSQSLVAQFYSNIGPFAPIGIYSKVGIRRLKREIDILSYTNERYGESPNGKASPDDFYMQESGSATLFRYGLGYNHLLNRSAMIGIESYMDRQIGGDLDLRSTSLGFQLLFKVSYIHFIL